jgi:hypothetical protein
MILKLPHLLCGTCIRFTVFSDKIQYIKIDSNIVFYMATYNMQYRRDFFYFVLFNDY